jgi:hypothetical protein
MSDYCQFSNDLLFIFALIFPYFHFSMVLVLVFFYSTNSLDSVSVPATLICSPKIYLLKQLINISGLSFHKHSTNMYLMSVASYIRIFMLMNFMLIIFKALQHGNLTCISIPLGEAKYELDIFKSMHSHFIIQIPIF